MAVGSPVAAITDTAMAAAVAAGDDSTVTALRAVAGQLQGLTPEEEHALQEALAGRLGEWTVWMEEGHEDGDGDGDGDGD